MALTMTEVATRRVAVMTLDVDPHALGQFFAHEKEVHGMLERQKIRDGTGHTPPPSSSQTCGRSAMDRSPMSQKMML